jgi:signal transduction histidine kinase
MERATRSADRLGSLITTLLDVSRIATGRFELHLERLDLREVAREAIDGLQDTARTTGSEMRVHMDQPLIGAWDRLRVEQIFTNLLSNALKYAPGAPISISASPAGGFAVVEIRDQGPGIPEGDLARIFGRFERAGASDRDGGMGLGLYVARQIAEAHGGSVDASNAPGGGACFTVRLPFASKQPQPSVPA